jgi:hypothetical protein
MLKLFGIIAFLGLGGIFFKEGCDHLRQRRNPDMLANERMAALALGPIFIAIGCSGFVLAAIVLFSN